MHAPTSGGSCPFQIKAVCIDKLETKQPPEIDIGRRATTPQELPTKFMSDPPPSGLSSEAVGKDRLQSTLVISPWLYIPLWKTLILKTQHRFLGQCEDLFLNKSGVTVIKVMGGYGMDFTSLVMLESKRVEWLDVGGQNGRS